MSKEDQNYYIHHNKIRVDAVGNPINSITKKHKVTFKDEVQPGGNVEDIFEVECWKKYNMDETEHKSNCCEVF